METGKFDHEGKNTMEVLGMKEERMNEIIGNAIQEMQKNSPNGRKSEFLEQIIKQCVTITEIIAATITWQMFGIQTDIEKDVKAVKSEEFANILTIRK